MAGIMDLVVSTLGNKGIDTIAKQLGTDSKLAKTAIQIALPAIIAGLARNATKSRKGADDLTRAIERDHDGSILDIFGESIREDEPSNGGLGSIFDALKGEERKPGLGGLLDGLLSNRNQPAPRRPLPKSVDGGGILEHVLGQKRRAVEDGVARSSGLDAKKVAALLPILAPLIMGALGKMKKEKQLDTGGLTDLLRDETNRFNPQTDSSTPGLLDFLDRDNDGQIADDLAKIGGALGGAGILNQILKGR